MPRVKAKVDKNQKKIVDELRKLNFSVFLTHQLGGGFPDIVVGFLGITFLFEIKNPETNSSLTEAEEKFFGGFQGHKAVAYTAQDCLNNMADFFDDAFSCPFVANYIRSLEIVKDEVDLLIEEGEKDGQGKALL